MNYLRRKLIMFEKHAPIKKCYVRANQAPL